MRLNSTPRQAVPETQGKRDKDVTRRSFLRGAAVLAAAAAPAAIGMSPGTARADEGDDDGPSIDLNFSDIRRHENAHVAALVATLGSHARPRPHFRGLLQRDVAHFMDVSQGLENTGVGAYLGAAPNILSRAYLAAAGSIALIEARHAGWLNSLLGPRLTANVYGREQSFETPLTVAQVVALASPYIQDLNGGPPLTYSSTPSASNDIAILNFALALEFLEQDFYNTNARFFAGDGDGDGTDDDNG